MIRRQLQFDACSGLNTASPLQNAERRFVRAVTMFSLIAFAALSAGCEKTPPPQFRFNEVEFLKHEKTRLDEGERYPEEYRTQISALTTALFGTPDEPKFPILHGDEDVGHEVLSLENLRMSAGPVASDENGIPTGLYREHCAHCHGITGDGAGPTAAFLNPYPRDFRLGKFKFKSTPLKQAPTNEDLTDIIRNGIPGTAMPAFTTLDPSEVESLVDYVKYLSIRGQYERRLIELATEDPEEPLLDVAVLDIDPEDPDYEDKYMDFVDRMFELVEYPLHEERIIDRWENPDRRITQVPDAPQAFDPDSPGYEEFLAHGKTVFYGAGNCTQCHGETGVGDGTTTNYDDWASDWVNKIRFDADDEESYIEFVHAGAMRPRPIRPRNLRMPVYRGGGQPDVIYRRIINGIEGTPMGSNPALTPEDIWALVAYVKSLPYEDDEEPVRPVNDQPIR
ncbi:MAG: cytochrome c [Planctomycetota bacterium]